MQRGMFSYTGLTEAQCGHLMQRWHVYLTPDGRISLTGLAGEAGGRPSTGRIRGLCLGNGALRGCWRCGWGCSAQAPHPVLGPTSFCRATLPLCRRGIQRCHPGIPSLNGAYQTRLS